MSEAQADKSAGVLFLERVRKGTDARRSVKWPGTDEVVGQLVPLTCAEQDAAIAAAWAHFRELEVQVNLYSSDDFNSELFLQVLSRALRQEDGKTTVFRDAAELRENLTADERTCITDEYADLLAEVNPRLRDLTPELAASIEAAVKKKDVVTLSGFGSNLLATYLLTMDDRQLN